MVSKKTFIITIVALLISFFAILILFYFYHVNKIQTLIIQKNGVTILNNESTGLENIVVE